MFATLIEVAKILAEAAAIEALAGPAAADLFLATKLEGVFVPIDLSAESSAIQSIEWHPLTETMEVTFAHGGPYRCEGASLADVNAFASAESPGSFFHERFK